MSHSAEQRIEEAWRRHAHELLRFARRRLNDNVLAEDLVQEAYLRLHRVTWPENVRGWLFQVTRNLIIDHWRGEVAAEPLTDELQHDEPSNFEQSRIELGDCLPQLLSKLPEQYREALRMVDLEEQSHQRYADRHRLSLSGAKSRVQRARRLLGKVLTQCCLFYKDRDGRVFDFVPKSKNSCVFSPMTASSRVDIKPKELSAMKSIVIEWRHLEVDGETCERCGDTGAELHTAIGSLNRECAAQGFTFELRDIPLDATALKQSNAIHIDGHPIETLLPQAQVGSSECSSCGTLTGDSGVECRTLECGDISYEAIPATLIREAACKAVACCASACGCS